MSRLLINLFCYSIVKMMWTRTLERMPSPSRLLPALLFSLIPYLVRFLLRTLRFLHKLKHKVLFHILLVLLKLLLLFLHKLKFLLLFREDILTRYLWLQPRFHLDILSLSLWLLLRLLDMWSHFLFLHRKVFP